MNEYHLADVEVGLKAGFQVVITPEMMDGFLAVSGDTNPLHNIEEYAAGKGFSGRVVYGMLTSALYSRLAGVHLPGKYCLLQGIDIVFQKPAYIGDVLDVSGTVSYVNEPYKMIEIRAEIRNQLAVRVSRAKIKVGFL